MKRTISPQALLPFALALLFLQIGCGGDSKTYGKVNGRVMSDGDPVIEAVVLFQEPQQHIFIQAITDAEGRYSFDKFPGEGLPVGNYQIAVQPPTQEIRTGEPLPPPKPFPKVDAKYLDPAKSGLQLSVHEGDNSFNVTLK